MSRTSTNSTVLIAGFLMMGLVSLGAEELEEALWDSCDSLEVQAPIFWQPAWHPRGLEIYRPGTLTVDSDEKYQGSGSIRWMVTEEEVEAYRSREPAPEFAMVNRLYGQNWGPARELRFQIRCDSPTRPEVFLQLAGHESYPSRTILERGVSTDGWAEIRWDLDDVDLGEHEEYGTRLWYFRLGVRTESFRKGDAIDIRIDNIRLVMDAATEIQDDPGYNGDSISGDMLVWAHHPLAKGSIRALPPKARTESLKVFATPGERVPAGFYVRAADSPLKDVCVVLEENLLTGSSASFLQNAASVRVVRSMKRWLDPGNFIPVEAWLVPAECIDIPAGISQRFHIDIDVPRNAQTGQYRATVTIKAEGVDPVSLDLELEVLPFGLDEMADMAYFMYYSPQLMPERFRGLEYHDIVFADMRARGMSTVTAYFHPRGDLLNQSREEFAPVAPTMEALGRAGLPAHGLPLLWIGADSYGEHVWQTLLTEGHKRDWPEFLFYMIDEPNPQRYPLVEGVMERLNEFRASHPEWIVRTTTAMGPRSIIDVGHHYDVWICSAGAVTEELVEKARQAGKDLWAYECHFAPTQAQLSRYYAGLWAWTSGVRGVAYWAYYDGGFYNRFGNIGSYEDIGDNWLEWTNHFNFVYPTAQGPIASVSWEAMSQGIVDYRYLLTLEGAIERARSSDTPRERLASAESLLEEVRAAMDIVEYRRPPQSPFADRSNADIFDRPAPSYPERAEGYDTLRRQIAEAIMTLQP